MSHATADLAAVRHAFEGRWVVWNVVRAVANLAAFACLAWALLLYGAHRDDPRSAGRPSGSAVPAHRSAPLPYSPYDAGPGPGRRL